MKELIRGRSWPSKAELRTEVFGYIEIFCNRRRHHSTLGMLAPARFERNHQPPTDKVESASIVAAKDPVSTEPGGVPETARCLVCTRTRAVRTAAESSAMRTTARARRRTLMQPVASALHASRCGRFANGLVRS